MPAPVWGTRAPSAAVLWSARRGGHGWRPCWAGQQHILACLYHTAKEVKVLDGEGAVVMLEGRRERELRRPSGIERGAWVASLVLGTSR